MRGAEYPHGAGGDRVHERRRKAEFLAFLEPLLVASPQGPIVLIGEHVSRPTAHAVSVWLDAHPRLPWGSWPTDWSPVNAVERIGRRLTNMLAPNRLYGSLQVFLQAVEAFFTAMIPAQALQWAAA